MINQGLIECIAYLNLGLPIWLNGMMVIPKSFSIVWKVSFCKSKAKSGKFNKKQYTGRISINLVMSDVIITCTVLV